jgi:hypothetical protein
MVPQSTSGPAGADVDAGVPTAEASKDGTAMANTTPMAMDSRKRVIPISRIMQGALKNGFSDTDYVEMSTKVNATIYWV